MKSSVIPNGVDTGQKCYDENTEKYESHQILFCGSLDYFPNEEGIVWFYDKVFPLIKEVIRDINLNMVGTERHSKRYKILTNDTSVRFIGKVPDVQPYYYNASVCIAPLLSGSGTRLKILEAMSFGNPVVATNIGAEGINYENEKHLLIADNPKEFAEKVICLLQNVEVFNSVRSNARKLVEEEYDWKKIGKKMRQELNKLSIKQ